MKTCVKLFLFLLIFVSFIPASEAVFVSYTDNKGKTHFVNTDYSKVPEPYLSQVQDQLKKNKDSNQNSDPAESSLPTDNSQVPNVKEKPLDLGNTVEVFIKANCQDCDRLLVLLNIHKIQYVKYDVENSQTAKSFYKTFENAELPITRIGEKVIFGNDIKAIENFLNPPVVAPAVAPAPAEILPTQQSASPATSVTSNYGEYTGGGYFKVKPLLKNRNEQ